MSAWMPLIVALLPLDAPVLKPELLAPQPASMAPAGLCSSSLASTLRPFDRVASERSTLTIASSMPEPTIRLAENVTNYSVPAIKMLPDSYGLGSMRPAIELVRADDGLFYVTGVINNQPIRFLVDTGASTITLTAADAARVGAAKTDEAPWVANTANGRRSMQRVRLARMVVGTTSAEDVPAAVAPDGLSVSLLGANWLTHVSSMMIEGDRMVIR